MGMSRELCDVKKDARAGVVFNMSPYGPRCASSKMVIWCEVSYHIVTGLSACSAAGLRCVGRVTTRMVVSRVRLW